MLASVLQHKRHCRQKKARQQTLIWDLNTSRERLDEDTKTHCAADKIRRNQHERPLTNLTVQKLKLDTWRSCECSVISEQITPRVFLRASKHFKFLLLSPFFPVKTLQTSVHAPVPSLGHVRQSAQRHEQTGVDVSEENNRSAETREGGGITDSSLTGTALETWCETFFATTLRKVWKGFSQKEAVAIRVTPRRERKKKKRHSSEEEVKVRRAGVSLYSDHIQAHDSKFCGLSLLLLEIPRKLMTWNLIVSLQGKVSVHYLIPDTEQHKDSFVYMI